LPWWVRRFGARSAPSARCLQVGGGATNALGKPFAIAISHPTSVRPLPTTLLGVTLCLWRDGPVQGEGFTHVELMATLAGEALYRACGYRPAGNVIDDRGAAAVPLWRMTKLLTP